MRRFPSDIIREDVVPFFNKLDRRISALEAKATPLKEKEIENCTTCIGCECEAANIIRVSCPAFVSRNKPSYTPAQLEILNALYTLGWFKAIYSSIDEVWLLYARNGHATPLMEAVKDAGINNAIYAILKVQLIPEFDIAKAVGR